MEGEEAVEDGEGLEDGERVEIQAIERCVHFKIERISEKQDVLTSKI